MNDYEVSAIKYRPRRFSDVVGQEALTSTLKSAIKSGRIAHSYLFCGPRGVGKTTCARILAKTINCEHVTPDGEPCNECDSCKMFNEGRSFNIHEIDAASNNSVNDIRDLIDQVDVKPQTGRYKVYIIDEVHMLSQGAFNAFLKTLEEPPSYVVFILATTEKQKILPTILSRCQIYDFRRIGAADIAAQLGRIARAEGISADEGSLQAIAEKADGGMRDALSLFDQQAVFTGGNLTCEQVLRNLNVLDSATYFKIFDDILSGDMPQLLLGYSDITARGYDGRDFIDGLARHARSLLLASDSRTMPLLQAASGNAEAYRRQAARCTSRQLTHILRLCSDCSLKWRGSRQRQLLVELTLLQAAQSCGDSHPSRAGEASEEGDGAQSDDDTHAEAFVSQLKPLFGQARRTRKTDLSSGGEPQSAAASQSSDAVQHTDKVSEPVGEESPASSQVTMAGMPALKVSSIRSMRRQARSPQSSGTAGGEVQSEVNGTAHGGEGGMATDTGGDSSSPVTPFDDAQLLRAWLDFAGQLPAEHADVAARMKAIIPHADSQWQVNVVCENARVVQFMQAVTPQLQAWLRRSLDNGRVTVVLSVAHDDPAQSPMLPAEAEFQKLTADNPQLSQLNSALKFKLI